MSFTKPFVALVCLCTGLGAPVMAAPQAASPPSPGGNSMAVFEDKLRALEAQLDQTQSQLRQIQSELGLPEAPISGNPSSALVQNAGPRAWNAALRQTQYALRGLKKDHEGVVLTAEEQEFVDRVNRERARQGLPTLTLDPLLETDARGHSSEMAALGYFSHYSPTPGIVTPMDRYLWGLHETQGVLPHSMLAGENLYRCNISNAESVALGHQALMNSPHHRANILDPRFRQIGIGIVHDARGQFWVTQVFAQTE